MTNHNNLNSIKIKLRKPLTLIFLVVISTGFSQTIT